MEMTPVASSQIAAAGWDEDTQTLEVDFMSGATYSYLNVPKDVFDGLITASSAGRYFASEIKGAYEYERKA